MGIERRETIAALRPLVQEVEQAQETPLDRGTEVMLFLSFDIVNSTRYKTENAGVWAEAVSEILRQMISTFANSAAGGYHFWKTLGDEVIYTKMIRRVTDIVDSLEEISSKLTALNDRIDDGTICDIKSGQMLAIKATAWVADISANCQMSDNIYTEYRINNNRHQMDYIGPDIDAGFRIAAHSKKNRLIISFELANLLYYFGEVDRVKLINYRPLKGVWSGSPYPIFLYQSDKKQAVEIATLECSLEEKAQMDAYLESLDGRHLGEDCDSYEERVLRLLTQEEWLRAKMDRLVGAILSENPVVYWETKPQWLAGYTSAVEKQKELQITDK